MASRVPRRKRKVGGSTWSVPLTGSLSYPLPASCPESVQRGSLGTSPMNQTSSP